MLHRQPDLAVSCVSIASDNNGPRNEQSPATSEKKREAESDRESESLDVEFHVVLK